MNLPPERPGYPAPAEVAARRDGMKQALDAGIWATEPPATVETIGGVRVLRWPPQGAPRARVLHFHGGGYRMGCPEMEGPYALALARDTGVEVISPQYRLAPEAPFPAALNDAWAVLQSTGDDLPLIISGGSAGGGVAAGLSLLARDAGRQIAGLILHSAWLDLTVSAASYTANGASDPLFSREAAEQGAELYLQGHSPRDPHASPGLAQLAGLPPVLITVGTGEVLYDDATAFAAALTAQGLPNRLLALEGMEHVAVTRNPDATGSAETYAAVLAFIETCLA